MPKKAPASSGLVTESRSGQALELPHLVWDLCDELFKDLGKMFASSREAYLRYLRNNIAATLGEHLHEKAGSAGRPHPKQTRTKVEEISRLLRGSGVDLVVAHFRSRRDRPENPSAWIRVIAGVLAHQSQLEANTLFNKWNLTQHAFERAKQNGTLLFSFMKGDTATPISGLSIPETDWTQLAAVVRYLREQPGIQKILPHLLKTPLLLTSPFSRDLQFYCSNHLVERFDHEQSRIAFLIESSIVTLTLLGEGLGAPRSALLVPVFVSSERVGGLSFFSNSVQALTAASRDLKIFSRNLLTYIAVREGHELEGEKRVLEEISPVTHLFIHTFNKAFTTPMLNIADDLNEIAWSLTDPSKTTSEPAVQADQLSTIATFIRCFARRWGGTFPALQLLSSPMSTTERGVRPRFVPVLYATIPPNQLREHIKAVYSLVMANDVFDDSTFSVYRSLLTRLGGLTRIVDLVLNFRHRLPGHCDIWLLHLLNLMQNCIEALPLASMLERARQSPQEVGKTFRLRVETKEMSSKTGAPCVVVELEDNGSGFNDDVRINQMKLFAEFSRSDQMPPSLWEVHKRIRENPSAYSTKSGESYASGLVGFADYLSRFCRIRVREIGELEGAEILERGRIEIEKRNPGKGSLIRAIVPVDFPLGNAAVLDSNTAVVFEIRNAGARK